MYTIEKSVPLPTRSYVTKYPFDEMAVNDSFEALNKDRAAVSVAMSVHNKGAKKFISRKTSETAFRVWRTA